jgi:hypothetical protein
LITSTKLIRTPAWRIDPFFTAELVDFFGVGRYDAFLAGHEQSGMAPAVLVPNDGTGQYVRSTPVVMPAAAGFGYALDAVFRNGAIYLARTIDNSAGFYSAAAIQKVRHPSLSSEILFQHTGVFPGVGKASIDWIIPYQGRIVTIEGAYNVSVPQ